MRRLTLTILIACSFTLLSACTGNADASIATLNHLATEAAGGSRATEDPNAPTAEESVEETSAPTVSPNLFDITGDQSALLASPWASIYGGRVPSGDSFTIRATERQVGDYIIQTLQQDGFIETVRGGNAQIGDGQIRLDFALQDSEGAQGGGTITFQPTLDGTTLRLNPSPASFGSLDLPGDFPPSIGDAVTKAFAGAASASLQQVTLNTIALDDGILTIEGTKR